MPKLTRLIVCLALVSMTSLAAVMPDSVYAKSSTKKEAKKENVVYATKQGKKYHREGCPFIKNRDTISMSQEEAEAKGLKPCGRCIKENKQAKK